MSSFKIWLEASRPKTLPAALVPVLLASALAFAVGGFRPLPAFLCLVFAVLIQVGTNFANDYLDAVKGSDTEQRIGPRRAVASGLIEPATMGRAALSGLAIGFCVGLGLIPFGGWWLLVVGIASVICAWCYTGGPYPFAYNGLGDVFVVVFFGLIATTCTYYVQVGSISGDALLLGLGIGALINNLLVVNNYRDVDEDRLHQKRTLVVYLGRRFARVQYQVSVLIAGFVGLLFWGNGYGLWVLITLLPIIYGIVLGRRLSSAKSSADFLHLLKGTAIVVLAYGILFSVGLILKSSFSL